MRGERREKCAVRLEHKVDESQGPEIDSQVGLYKTEKGFDCQAKGPILIDQPILIGFMVTHSS